MLNSRSVVQTILLLSTFLLPPVVLAGSTRNEAPTTLQQNPSLVLKKKTAANQAQLSIWKPHSGFLNQLLYGHTDFSSLKDYWIRQNGLQVILDYYALDPNAVKDRRLSDILLDRAGWLADAGLEPPYINFHFKDWGLSNDDLIWGSLASIRAYDLSGRREDIFMREAEGCVAIVKSTWNDQCGGGVAWSKKDGYKNTITNVLFYQLNVEIWARKSGNDALLYKNEALKTLAWLEGASGLYDAKVGAWRDGIDPSTNCGMDVKQSRIFSYQFGPLLAGLTAQASIPGENRDELMAKATRYALKSLPNFVDGKSGVIREADLCDTVPDDPEACGVNEGLFKGIYVRGLGAVVRASMLDPNKPPQKMEKLVAALQASLQSMVQKGMGRDSSFSRHTFGINWQGPSARHDAWSQIEAMDLYNANSVLDTAAPLVVCIFEDRNYGGSSSCWRGNGYYDVELNDAASSILVAEGCEVEVATDGGMQGKRGKFRGEGPWIGAEFNDQISSLTITCY